MGRPAFKALAAYARRRYEHAIKHIDVIIANSHNVQDRIRKYLGRDAVVIYPPCDTERFLWRGQGDYYLSTARLEPYKRVDRIVESFLCLPDKQLMVASGGSELSRLKQLASGSDNIHFTGWTGEQGLSRLIGNAIATIYLPKDEDFGMSPVELMAAGKPVIGVAEGGLLETVIPEQTGILLNPEFRVQDITDAVDRLTPERALKMRSACEQQATHFRKQVFIEKKRSTLEHIGLASK